MLASVVNSRLHLNAGRSGLSRPPFVPLFCLGLFAPCFSICAFLHSLLQICPFVFNHFHDAPPASLFFSIFCIVAGGGYTPQPPKGSFLCVQWNARSEGL